MRRNFVWWLLAAVLLLGACSAPPSIYPRGEPAPARSQLGLMQVLAYDGGRLVVRAQGGQCSIALEGAINRAAGVQLNQAFEALLRSNCQQRWLVLDPSDAGSTIGAAINIGSAVRNRQYHTQIRPSARCNTPCAFVFAAGLERIQPDTVPATFVVLTQVPPDSDFRRNACATEISPQQSQQMSRYLQAMLGVDPANEFMRQLLSATCERSVGLRPDFARPMGLTTRLISECTICAR